MYRNGIKRLLAVILSLCGMIVLSPLLLILCLAIKIDSPGPIFFRQKRVGIHKQHFNILKFRTMRIDTPHDMPTHLLHDPDQYITRMGHFLRKTSLDELPQLWDILVGSMSIVGPRPPLPCEVAAYTDYERQRLYVRPGLTCIWQIQPNRNDVTFDEWMDMDMRYIRDRSFLLDWKLIFGTVWTVFAGTGE